MSVIGEPRAFLRDRDLRPLVRLIASAHATGARPDFWHPGGMQWWLRRIAKDDFKVFVWDEGGDIAGFVIDDGGHVIARSSRRDPSATAEVIEWAEAHRRADGRTTIEISVADDEIELRALIEGRSYEPSGAVSTELVYDVRGEPPAPAPPPVTA